MSSQNRHDTTKKRRADGVMTTQREHKKPRPAPHRCEVTLDQLFHERQEWRSVAKNLQGQIDTIRAWGPPLGAQQVEVRPTVGAAGTDANPTAGAAGVTGSTSARPEMPKDHPLSLFLEECFVKTDWDSRCLVGFVRRRYAQWWAEHRRVAAGKSGQKPMNHIRFSAEMKKYFHRTGSQRNSCYIGLALPAGASAAGSTSPRTTTAGTAIATTTEYISDTESAPSSSSELA
jgi:hypothetical protein